MPANATICRLATPAQPIALDAPRKFWKELIRTGRWTNPRAGFTLEVDRPRLQKWLDSFRAMRSAGIRVPLPWGHSYDPRDNAGFVDDLELRDGALWGLLDLPLPTDADKLGKTVAAVSVSIHPDFTDGAGRRWGEVIEHVALTNYPVVTGQADFLHAADAPAALTLELTDESTTNAPSHQEQRKPGDSPVVPSCRGGEENPSSPPSSSLRDLRGEGASPRLIQLELEHANREVDDALRSGKFTRPAADALRQLLGAGLAARYALDSAPPDLAALARTIIAATPDGAAVDLVERTRLHPMPDAHAPLTDARAAQLARENKALAKL